MSKPQRILIPTLARIGVTRLHAAVLTHPDIDHCRGLLGLSSFLPIDVLYTTAGWPMEDCVSEMLGRAAIAVSPLWTGQSVDMGAWRLSTLHPPAGRRQGRNDRSLVLLAEAYEHRVLLTGDLEAAGEREILARFSAQRFGPVDILKIGHHGSRSSTSDALLSRIEPRLALISCGRANRYGHPAGEVLERLRDADVRVLRTDLHGAIDLRMPAGRPIQIGLPGQPLP